MEQYFSSTERKELSPQILCPVETFFNIKGEIKIFSGEEKLRKFIASKPTLKE